MKTIKQIADEFKAELSMRRAVQMVDTNSEGNHFLYYRNICGHYGNTWFDISFRKYDDETIDIKLSHCTEMPNFFYKKLREIDSEVTIVKTPSN